ncbi:hypothetical protein B296_00022113 [Ensete ventricosum]|uniref:Glycosyltransferase n=1 Tax=Ensete ventricosum TaxID=4639 RepID=A0A426YNZ1_ENSVE|nr:hypothetical protein B296_00022113 [Ensete ventricosum]
MDEILVVPFPHAGHIFPATQLSAHLARRNYKVTLILPSSSSSSASSPPHPLVRIVDFSLPHTNRIQPQLLEDTLHALLAGIFQHVGLEHHQDASFPSSLPRKPPLCVIVDDMISGLIDTCVQHQVPVVSFFTSGASAAALDHATLELSPEDFASAPLSTAVTIPDLPTEMALTASDVSSRHQPFGGPGSVGGPRRLRGIAGADGAVALLVNTCDELERPFLDYVAKKAGKPAWGVGPLLPDQFWAAVGPVRDGEVRSGHEFGVDEKELVEWLDAKPPRSVIYVSFGSLVSPADDELSQLAAALDESNRPFVWVMQTKSRKFDPAGQPIEATGDGGNGFFSTEAVARRGEARGRGMVIRGWAPQLLILSHPSVGGFVSHCGWNSTVEALVCGVPMLTWPVRGDQHHNAKLVVRRLGTGCAIRDPERCSSAAALTKEDVVAGIERLMGDDGIRKRAASVRAVFAGGFPESSSSSLDDFLASLSLEQLY